MNFYAELALTFFRIGLFTIGGGYAMLPLIQQEIVGRGWLTNAEFIDIVAIAEMTPGAIGINAATFVGFRLTGVLGSLVATTFIALPSFLIIVGLSRFWAKHKDHAVTLAVFSGIRPAVAALIVGAALYIGRTALLGDPLSEPSQSLLPVDLRSVLLAAGTFVAVMRWKWDPIKLMLMAAAAGLLVFSY